MATEQQEPIVDWKREIRRMGEVKPVRRPNLGPLSPEERRFTEAIERMGRNEVDLDRQLGPFYRFPEL